MMDSTFLSFGKVKCSKTKFDFDEKKQKGSKLYL